MTTETETTGQASEQERNRRIHEDLMGLCVHEWEQISEELPETKYIAAPLLSAIWATGYICKKCGHEMKSSQSPSDGVLLYSTFLLHSRMVVTRLKELGVTDTNCRRTGDIFNMWVHDPSIVGQGWTEDEAVVNAAIAWLDWRKEQGEK